MKSVVLPFAALLLGLTHSLATANDAAMNDGSSGPEPVGWRSGAESIIQMKSEHIAVHFGVKRSQVTAQFTFLSHKKSGPAKQKLGFPDYSRSELDGDIAGPIENLVTKVNGQVVPSKLEEGYFEEIIKEDGSIFYESRPKPAAGDEYGPVRKYAWYIIEVEFPVGEEVLVERSYELPSGASSMNESFFIYETRTGAAWRGDIEQLTAEVTFAPDVRTDLILFEPQDEWTWNSDKTKATLVWKDFEPREDEGRQYFEVITLDLERVAAMHKEGPKDFPDVETAVTNWKKLREGQ